MAKTRKTGLGKGLGALLPNVTVEEKSTDAIAPSMEISLSDIIKNPYQPRIDFDPDELEDLKNSILQHGVITPITVKKSQEGYILIAGERRLRASKEAGLDKIPAYVREVETQSEMLEIALIENLQRDDLNPIETAYGFKRLIDECGLTQEKVALKVGKNRSTVTNFLRLIRLPEEIQGALRSSKISTGHARALLSLDDSNLILEAYNRVLKGELSVRETENLVKSISKPKARKSDSKQDNNVKTSEIIAFEDKLRHHLSTEVKINSKNNKSGKIVIDFYNEDDFERIIEQLTGE